MKKAKTYCIAFGCPNNNKDPNLTFFSLPKDIERRKHWLKLIDREDLLQKEHMKRKTNVVCSAHFEDSFIKVIRHLKEDSVPTIHLPNQAKESSSAEEPSTSKQSDKVIKNKKYTVGTQTEPLQSIVKQTQSSIDDGSPRNRKLSIEIEEYEMKPQIIKQEVIVKEEFE